MLAKFVAWFKKHFTHSSTGGGGTVTQPDGTVVDIPETANVKGTKVALVLGHSFTGPDKGATGNGTNEVAYNSAVMDLVKAELGDLVSVVKGSSSVDAAIKAKALSPDIVIQMHLNAYNGTAKGCEVLVVKGDSKSYPLAEKFAKEFTDAFSNVPMRRFSDQGKKILSSNDRGVTSLITSGSVKKVLVEPFFIDNSANFVPKEEYAKFLIKFIRSLL